MLYSPIKFNQMGSSMRYFSIFVCIISLSFLGCGEESSDGGTGTGSGTGAGTNTATTGTGTPTGTGTGSGTGTGTSTGTGTGIGGGTGTGAGTGTGPSKECPKDQHNENGQCLPNTKSCLVVNGTGEQKWLNNSWQACSIKSCNEGFSVNANKCEKVSFPKDPKTCDAAKFHSDTKELKLSSSIWCGDLKGRFKLENKGNDFIYDAMLKGYWSKLNSKSSNWADAKTHCSSLGTGWAMPEIFHLLSLVSQKSDANQGYINPIFSDNAKKKLWSKTGSPMIFASRAQSAYISDFENSYILNDKKSNTHSIRCFRLKP